MAGQIVAKGDRKWLVRVFQGRNADGKRSYVSELVHGGKKDAERRLRVLLSKKSEGTLGIVTEGSMSDYLDAWLAGIRTSVRARTHHDYTRVVTDYIKPHVGAMPIQGFGILEVLGMIADLEQRGLSPRTVRMAHEVLRNALENAVPEVLPSNPARSRKVTKALPSKVRKEPETIPAAKVADFLDVAAADRLGALWTLQILSGLRPSEALALRWSDVTKDTVSVTRVLVDKGGNGLHFAPPKSRTSRRAVVVPQIVVEALRVHRKQQAEERLSAPSWEDGNLIFCDEAGRPLRQDPVRYRFRQVLKAAGLTGVTLYGLRHTCATLLLEEGVPLKVVSERLGHSTIALTADVYSHVSRSMQEHAADVLGKVAGGLDS